MKNINISDSKQLTDYTTKVFGEISLAVQDAVNQTLDEIAKECVKQLKAKSPKEKIKSGGRYAKGWRYKTTKVRADGSFSVVIYNGRYGWLTHLLENGHPLKQKDGSVVWVEGRPHIKPVNDWLQTDGVKKLQETISQNIQNIKT